MNPENLRYGLAMNPTRSECLFEQFLELHEIAYKRIPVGPARTPDFKIKLEGRYIVFEVKEIVSDTKWDPLAVHSRKIGKHIREKINGSKGQLHSVSKDGTPTVLLIFNAYDPMQLYGTENHDFETAMYGEYTLKINCETHQIVDSFHGNGKAFQASKNTSFSALGRLRAEKNGVSITLFKNVHATVPLPYDLMPSCFNIVDVEWPSNYTLE